MQIKLIACPSISVLSPPHLSMSTLGGKASSRHSTRVQIKLQVDRPFNITKGFHPMRRSKKSPTVGDICTVCGWGFTEYVRL